MKKVSYVSGLLAVSLAGSLSLTAQSFEQPNSPEYNPKASYEGPYKMNTWSVSAHIGPGQYFGDLREYDFLPVTKNNSDSHNEVSLQGGVTLHKQFSYLLGARADVSFGGLNGMKRRLYNSYFTGRYTDAALMTTVNLKGLLMGPNKMKRWKIDGYVGAGQVWYSSKAYQLGTGEQIRSTDGTRNAWIIPMGMTINYELTPKLDIGLDFRANRANTDYLDATYGGTDPNETPGQPTDRKGTSAIDMYGGGSVVLTYKLGKKPLKVKKENGKYAYRPDEGGYYHLRHTDPKLLVKPPKILSLEEMDSVAKANRPEDIDPKLLLDTDGDGVSDFFDKEPASPAGSIVDGSGRVIDFDSFVKKALSTGLACTEVFANVTFDTDKSVLTTEFKQVLDNVARLMNKNGCRLQLSGHADRRASDRYNLALSKRRVEAVRNYLVKEAGLKDPNKILYDYFGSFKPIADGASREGLKKNRRVELRLLP